ncbi:hypothetical protein NBRC116495_05360 [Aurantivibrio plasticivorans]
MTLKHFRDAYGNDWYWAAAIPLGVDLTPVLGYLHQQNVTYRVMEEHGEQTLWLRQGGLVDNVAEFVSRWRDGEVRIEVSSEPSPDSAPNTSQSHTAYVGQPRLIDLMLSSPITCIGLALCFFGLIAVEFSNVTPFYRWLIFVDPEQLWQGVIGDFVVPWHQPWRFLSPIFIHYGWFHILGNGLFLWYFGIRIERVLGSFQFFVLVVLMGVVSNIGQFAWEQNPHFGGFSGVNYGFIGFIIMRQITKPHPLLAVPPGILVVSLVMLVAGMMGVVDIFMNGGIANAAHVVGLLMGLTCGFVSAINSRAK